MGQIVSNNSKALAQRLNNLVECDLSTVQKEAFDTMYVLDAMLLIKEYVEDLSQHTSESALKMDLKTEDINGWPGFQIYAYYGETEVGKLVIGAQNRRNGVVVFFRNTHLDKSLELAPAQYNLKEELIRSLKKVFREFIDELEDVIDLGNKNGSFDQSEDLELADLALENKTSGARDQEQLDKVSAGMFSDLSSNEEDDVSLDNLDLFAE